MGSRQYLPQVWYELFVITSSIAGVFAFLIYLLASRIPGPQQQLEIATLAINTVVEERLKEFNLGPDKGGGSSGEGFLDKILAIPGVQTYIGNMLNKQTGGMSYGA